MNESMTPYAFCKYVNAELGTNLPPQMFYTYAKKNYIASVKNEAGKVLLTPEGMQQWFTARLAKQGGNTTSGLYTTKLVVNLTK